MADLDVSSGFHIFKDGNMWCAVGPTFRDLQQDRAGFGETPVVAYAKWWEANAMRGGFRTGWAKPSFEKFIIHHVVSDGPIERAMDDAMTNDTHDEAVEAVGEESLASYQEYKPTWRDYFRLMFGYHRHVPDVDKHPDAAVMPGWFKTVVHVHLDIWDRLRLLVSGRVLVEIENRANVSVDRVISDSAVTIVSPFEQKWTQR